MKKEIHLFIIWEKARQYEREIIRDIESKFKILQTFSITWSPYNVSKNFTRFYGQKLPKNSHKELHCGKGEFRLIVVEDENPIYEKRATSSGVRYVNINMFDSKMKYRKLTGGGHKIHGTDNITETKHDLALLIGYSVNDFLEKFPKNQNDIKLKQDLIGTNGWKSFNELFYVLNECAEYLVLRNPQNITLEYFKNNEGDIDLLVNNREEICYILGDIEAVNDRNKHLEIDVDKNIVFFEIYERGKNLFYKKFEDDLFKYKEKTNLIYHPNQEMHFFAHVYHALILNKTFTKKHKDRLKDEIKKLASIPKIDINEVSLLNELNKYFIKNEYYYIAPDDIHIYFNKRKEIRNRLLSNPKRVLNLFKSKLAKVVDINISKDFWKITLFRFMPNIFYFELNLKFLPKLYIMLGSRKYR